MISISSNHATLFPKNEAGMILLQASPMHLQMYMISVDYKIALKSLFWCIKKNLSHYWHDPQNLIRDRAQSPRRFLISRTVGVSNKINSVQPSGRGCPQKMVENVYSAATINLGWWWAWFGIGYASNLCQLVCVCPGLWSWLHEPCTFIKWLG